MKPLGVIVLFFTLCYASQWEQVGPYAGLPARIGVAPSNDNVIYGFGNTYPVRVYKTTDGGVSWHTTASPFYMVPITFDVAIDPTNPDIVYAGGIQCDDNWDIADTVYKSTDGGVNWTPSYIGNGILIHALAVHPTSPSVVFAGVALWDTIDQWYHIGVSKSTDGGITWTTTDASLEPGEAYDIAIDPSNPNVIYVGGYTSTAAIYKSTDGGASFTNASSGLSTGSIYALAVHPTNSQYVYAGSTSGHICRSTNSGTSWSSVDSLNRGVYGLATTPANPTIVYVSTDNRVYKSTDSGTSWAATDSGPACGVGLAVIRTDANTVFSSNYYGVYKTTNGGTTWFASNKGIDWIAIRGIGIAPSSPSILYASNYYDYKTTNGGQNWSVLPQCLGGFSAIAVHNTDPDIVFGFSCCG